MRLLIATPLYPPQIGGPAKYAQSLKAALETQGHTIRVVAYGRLERGLPAGLRHVAYALRLLPRVLRADAVLALDTWSVGLPALCMAKLFGARFLVRIGGDFLWESYVERTRQLVTLSAFYDAPRSLSVKERAVFRGTSFLLRRADALLFTTEWQRALWQRAYGFPTERGHIVENMYPAVHPAVASGKKKIFVAAGRAIALKNMTLLTSVFSEVQKAHPDIELDTRALPSADHASRVAACYAVIVPSVSEVNPNTAIEAFAAGKPFIAPKDSGIVRRLADVGIFIDTQDKEALKGAIEALLVPEYYAARINALAAFSYTHSWEEMAHEVTAIAARS